MAVEAFCSAGRLACEAAQGQSLLISRHVIGSRIGGPKGEWPPTAAVPGSFCFQRPYQKRSLAQRLLGEKMAGDPVMWPNSRQISNGLPFAEVPGTFSTLGTCRNMGAPRYGTGIKTQPARSNTSAALRSQSRHPGEDRRETPTDVRANHLRGRSASLRWPHSSDRRSERVAEAG